MRVPDQAANGIARLALSFADWKEGHVQPATAELPVERKEAAASPELRATLIGHPDPVTAIAFTRDGKTLVSASADGTLKLWDAVTGREQATLQGSQRPLGWIGGPSSLAITQDQKHLLVSWTDLDLHPNTDIVEQFVGTVKVWDLAKRQALPGFAMDKQYGVHHLVLSADGHTLGLARYNVGGKRRAEIWDLATQQRRKLIDNYANVLGAGERIFAAAAEKEGISLWSGDAPDPPASKNEHGVDVAYLGMTADGQALACHDGKHAIKICETKSRAGRVRADFPDGEFPRAMTFSPDGRLLAVAIGHHDWPDESPGVTALLDAATLKRLRTLTGHTLVIRCLAFSPDGRTLASGSSDKTIRLWNVPELIDRN